MEKKYTFDEFNISENTLKALYNLGFEATTEVQSLSLSEALSGKDLLVKSQTGTGKTAVYGVTFTEKAEIDVKGIQCLVMTPTRELTLQVSEEMKNIGRFRRLKVLPIYGGQEIEGQKKNLRQRVHAIIGTPGRILDHVMRGNLDLSCVKLLVVDEVDVMYDMGFVEDIEKIIKCVPKNRQTMMFSATISQDIEQLAKKNMISPIKIEAAPEIISPAAIDQYYYETDENDKFTTLCKILSKESKEMNSAIIFCNTRKTVVNLAKMARREGMGIYTLHGDMPQDERTLSINGFKEGNVRLLIATDVAARGLDIENVTHVINYDTPKNYESYVHRIGRTGRAGRTGIAITLVLEEEMRYLASIEAFMQKSLSPGKALSEDIELGAFKKIKLQQETSKTEGHKNSDKLGEITRLHINAGRKDKISAGDIVGAIIRNSDLGSDDIGVIDIYDNYSFVEIMNEKGCEVLNAMANCVIKKKRVKITQANGPK